MRGGRRAREYYSDSANFYTYCLARSLHALSPADLPSREKARDAFLEINARR